MSKHLFLSKATRRELSDILDGILRIYDKEGMFDSVIVLDNFTGAEVLGGGYFGAFATHHKVRDKRVAKKVDEVELIFTRLGLANLPTLDEVTYDFDYEHRTLVGDKQNLKKALRGFFVGYLPLFLLYCDITGGVIFVDNNENVKGRVEGFYEVLSAKDTYDKLKAGLGFFEDNVVESSQFIFLPGKLSNDLSTGSYIYDGQSLRPYDLAYYADLLRRGAPRAVYDIVNPKSVLFHSDLRGKVVISNDLLDEQLIDFVAVKGASAYVSSNLKLAPGRAVVKEHTMLLNPSNIDEGIVSVLYVSGGRVDYKPYRIF